MKKVKISIECGIVPPDDGVINVWWWKDGKDFNTEWKAIKPVWKIFNAKQTFDLCVIGETIEISKSKLFNNFYELE